MKLTEQRFDLDRSTLQREAAVDISGDLLGRRSLARSVDRAIRATPAGWSIRIGLYGEWGSGKSSVLKMLRQLQEERGAIVIEFSAWSGSGEGGVLELFCEALRDRLDTLKVKHPSIEPLAKRLAGVGGRAAAFLSETTAKASESAGEKYGPAMAAIAGALSAGGSALRTLGQFKPEDLALIAEAVEHRQVVVYIDDLDRADARALPHTLLALRGLLDWPGFAFVLAFDRDVVADALAEYSKAYGNAQRFLEKVVDIGFSLEEPSVAQRAAFASQVLELCCPFIPERDRETLARCFPANPRRSKLVARKLAVLTEVAARHRPDEINWIGLGLQYLLRESNEVLSRRVEEAKFLGMEAAIGDAMRRVSPSGREANVDRISQILDCAVDDGLFESELEKKWFDTLLRALVDARSRQSVQMIDYEMGLLDREPALTWKEYDDFLERWLKSGDDYLTEFLTTASSSVEASKADVVRELFETTLRSYDKNLSRASDTSLMNDHAKFIESAEKDLQLLSGLVVTSTDPDIQRHRCDTAVGLEAYNVFLKWCHFLGNEDDRKLRQLELTLMLEISRRSEDKVAIYFETEPNDPTVHAYSGSDAQKHYVAFKNTLRNAISIDVCEQAVEWFREPRGVAIAIAGDRYPLGGWLLCSPESPLYSTPSGSSVLLKVLEGARELTDLATAGITIGNVLSYLTSLAGFDSGWISGPAARKEFARQQRDVFIAAWRTLSEPQRQFRAIFQLGRIRDALLADDVSEAEVPWPVWFKPDS